jgi:hypothetical protein
VTSQGMNPYFSKDQYYSSIKRGVVELDDKCFKIYTKALLQQKRSQQQLDDDFADLLLPSSAITLSQSQLTHYVDTSVKRMQINELEQKLSAIGFLH